MSLISTYDEVALFVTTKSHVSPIANTQYRKLFINFIQSS